MAGKIKILYLITQAEAGGAQRYIFDLATNLKNENYEVMVASGTTSDYHDKKSWLLTKADEKNIKSYCLKNLVREINPLKDWLAYLEIKKLLKETQPDILHLNSSKAGVLGALAGRRIKIPKIIYTVHGFVFNEPMPSWKKKFYLWAEKFSASAKDKFICVSEFDRQTGIKNKIAPAQNFITIHHGLNQFKLLEKNQARESLKLPKDKIVVGTIANFYPAKGLIYLIQAAKIVTEKFPEIIFRIIGFGQLEKKLRAEIASLNLEKNILLGGKAGAASYLKAFDLFVLSSVKEGFPFAILEAMSAGLPIVATQVGGVPEMIKDGLNGLVVPPAEPPKLAEAIIRLLANKNLAQQLGQQAAIDVKNNFSLEKMVRETEKIYCQ